MALDPITLSLLMATPKLIGGFVDHRRDRRLAQEREDFYENMQANALQQMAQARQDRRRSLNEIEVGEGYRRFLDRAMADPQADIERREALRQQATSVGALKAGGARALLGGLGAVSQQTDRSMADIGSREAQRKQSALQTYGAAEQAQDNLRSARRFSIGAADLSRSQRLIDRANFGRQQAELDRLGANFDLAQSGLDFADQGLQNMIAQGLFDPKSEEYDPSSTADKIAAGELPDNQGYQLADGSVLNPNMDLGAYGAYGGSYKTGGKTPGAFSHEINPIDLIRNGEKVGEATGNEYIVNPEQARKMSKESAFARRLFKKFDREA
jgi:hypothetical protein